MKPIVDVVVVTYNRLSKLQKALKCYEDQTIPFRNLILVNNCSTDETPAFIAKWQEKPASFNKIVINTTENLGGSGGFYLGQKKAMDLKADWVYLADDDAYANSRLMEQFNEYMNGHNSNNYSALCTSVVMMDGTYCSGHRSRWMLKYGKFFLYDVPAEEYEKESFNVDFLSYVGSFINVKAMRKVGTVNPRYFIYSDDREHSFRLKKYGEIVCVPSMKVLHDCGTSDIPDDIFTWRNYYDIRNKYHMLLKHMPFIVSLRMIKRFFQYKGRDWYHDENHLVIYRDAVWHAMLGILGKNKKYLP